MNREQMAYRCPNATILRVVRLEGYELEFAGMAGNGVATIRPKEGSYVDGVLWKITPKCERGLDFYEGYPHFYGKEMLTVKDRLGENHGVCHERAVLPQPGNARKILSAGHSGRMR